MAIAQEDALSVIALAEAQARKEADTLEAIAAGTLDRSWGRCSGTQDDELRLAKVLPWNRQRARRVQGSAL